MALGDLMATTRFSYSSTSHSTSSSSNTSTTIAAASTSVPFHPKRHFDNNVDEFPDYVSGAVCEDVGCNVRESEESSDLSAGGMAMATATATNMAYLPQTVVLCDLRHDALNESSSTTEGSETSWRLKERMRTGSVALVLCLNINIDPPDVIKISPCARMECWIDPFSMPPSKALDAIGKSLYAQYERWQPKARYRLQPDPTFEEVKKLCIISRKSARSERVLFHYNGHGVPKPTSNGEIWVFNKGYTQYIPLPVSELDSWLKTPSIYVFDCCASGMIVDSFIDWISSGATTSLSKDCIMLAACQSHETLPQSAEFPADIFTSCLTTPIKMALRWFCSRSLLRDFIDVDLIDQIPGRQNDRKTLLGELNWIYTAVTDTIAWDVLPRDMFQKLFRQDLLVASLFRNFILANRIMRSANCSPVSHPSLPSTHQHHMWDAWDMAAECCLAKLPSLIHDADAEFQPSPFFTEQLTAFEVWLDHGSEYKKPPEQLPIVLQVLLSHSHRFRALVLLGRFLDMGHWAVHLALSVGVFPYVLKMLQTTASELQNILIFLWTKILAFDKSCQDGLVKDGGHIYFIRFLDSIEVYPEQRAMAAFILAVIMDGHRLGQQACIQENLIHVCLRHLELANTNDTQAEPLLLQWLCLCQGKLWEDFPAAQLIGLQADAPAIFSSLLSEPQPEVRASAVFALGTLLNVGSEHTDDDDEKIKIELTIIKSLLDLASDGSPLVRAEVAVALARFAFGHNKHLKSVAASYWKSQPKSMLSSLTNTSSLNANPTGQTISAKSSQISSAIKVVDDSSVTACDVRVSSSSPLTSTGFMHGSPLSDHSDSGILCQENGNTGVIGYLSSKPLEPAVYSNCVLALYSMAKDPYPQIAKLGQRILSIIGIEQVVAKPSRLAGSLFRQGDSSGLSPSSTLAGLVRSTSWLDMSAGPLQLSFRTPPVSPPRQKMISGLRRVCSLEFRPHQLNSPDSGLADPILGSCVSMASEQSLLPQSTIYQWSCGHFSQPLLTAEDENEELLTKRDNTERFALDRISKCQHSSFGKLDNQIANWDTKFETGTKTTLLMPFTPFVVAADQIERIRIWNYEKGVPINAFENHTSPDKGISKLCLLNELSDALLLVASFDGNIRIWKDFTIKGKQKLITAFSSIQSHGPGVHNANVVVDWQQQSGYLYASSGILPMMLWDLDKEQLVKSISSSSSDSSISELSASQVHGGQLTAGYEDGSVKLFDVRTPDMLVCKARPHTQRVQRVVGIGFQPGFEHSKIVSASQAGDIQFLDFRNPSSSYLTIDAHRGSLTALAIHRHAPVIASGSAKQLIKVFSLKGDLLSTIRYYPSFIAQRIGSINSLTFHPYNAILSAGASDAIVSIYDDNSFSR